MIPGRAVVAEGEAAWERGRAVASEREQWAQVKGTSRWLLSRHNA